LGNFPKNFLENLGEEVGTFNPGEKEFNRRNWFPKGWEGTQPLLKCLKWGSNPPPKFKALFNKKAQRGRKP